MKAISPIFLIKGIAAILLFNSCGSKSEAKPTEEAYADYKSEVEEIIEEYVECRDEADKPIDCNEFTLKALDRIYDLPEVKEDGVFRQPSELAEEIPGSFDWEEIGPANNQENLNRAHELAGKGYAVVAIDEPFTHLAIIVGGEEMVTSGSWELDCPLTISVFHGSNYVKSFIGKGLNYSYSSPENITLFNRLYRDF
jgi:hypothetical protein